MNGKWSRVDFECAANYEQRPVDWLWLNRIARGKLTLIAGDPGLGKSQIGVDMIARITSNRAWPGGGQAPIGNCVILSAEDAPADTIVPRLDLAGADLGRVGILKSVSEGEGRRRSFNLQDDLDALGSEITRVDSVVLAIIDPITAYLGKTDSHKTADVRAVLEKLDQFAETHRVAIVGITHPPKAIQSKAIHAFTGSLAFVAAARLAFIVIEEPETGRNLLLSVKNNIGPKAPGIAYRLTARPNSKGIVTPQVVWDSAPVNVTANEAMRMDAEANSRNTSIDEAMKFLREYLADGPKSVPEMQETATANGISKRTLERARKQLGVVAEKDNGVLGGWTVRLP